MSPTGIAYLPSLTPVQHSGISQSGLVRGLEAVELREANHVSVVLSSGESGGIFGVPSNVAHGLLGESRSLPRVSRPPIQGRTCSRIRVSRRKDCPAG